MQTFQIEQKSEKAREQGKKPQPRQLHYDGYEQVDRPERQAEQDIRDDAHPNGA